VVSKKIASVSKLDAERDDDDDEHDVVVADGGGGDDGAHVDDPEDSSTAKALITPHDLECAVCTSLLFKPVTTPCGHTFCQPCLARSLDHATQCPVCRTTVYVMSNSPVNVLLLSIIQRSFPALYAARAREEATLAAAQNPSMTGDVLPLFIIDAVVFPGMAFDLHIFEPRYRLMLRRALEGSRTFGVVCARPGNRIAPFGTMVEIVSHQPLPDGRSLIETVGRRRFEIRSVDEVDSYAVGELAFFDDDDDDASDRATTGATTGADSDAAAAAAATTTGAAGAAVGGGTAPTVPSNDELVRQIHMVVQLRSGVARWERVRAAIAAKFGPIPVDPREFGFWFAATIPFSHDGKLTLLSCRSTRLRLTKILEFLNAQSSAFPCEVQ
jgi:Lon protease-like protein